MSSVWFLPIFVMIFGIVIVIVVILIVVKLLKNASLVDVSPNAPIIDNSARRHFTEGYSFGIVKRELPRKNGNVLVEFYPFDADQGEYNPRPNLQSVVIGREYMKRFARGEFSSRREFIRAVARSPADLPEKMRGTKEGEWETKVGQLAFMERVFGKAIPFGDDALAHQILEWSRGHISRATLAQIKEQNKETNKMLPSVKVEEKS